MIFSIVVIFSIVGWALPTNSAAIDATDRTSQVISNSNGGQCPPFGLFAHGVFDVGEVEAKSEIRTPDPDCPNGGGITPRLQTKLSPTAV